MLGCGFNGQYVGSRIRIHTKSNLFSLLSLTRGSCSKSDRADRGKWIVLNCQVVEMKVQVSGSYNKFSDGVVVVTGIRAIHKSDTGRLTITKGKRPQKEYGRKKF